MRNSDSTYNIKRLVLPVVITALIILINSPGYSQDKIFTLQHEVGHKVRINYTFTEDTLINPFKFIRSISGLAISCDLHLNSDTSLVRIILVDEKYNEFLICESYPLLSSSMSFSLTDYAEETSSLDNINPLEIKFEIIDASVYLKEITTSKEQIKTERAIDDALRQQNLEKIKKLNENIKRENGLWVAGETSVSKMTYQEKKRLFGGEIPNLQGFEYYSGGIFEFSNSKIANSGFTPFEKNINSNIVPCFDWRNRHGANIPGSPYYNNNPGSQGWITPVKDQGSCGSCWIFGPVGAIEAKVNLYFNHHIDIDLSEQNVLSCNGGAGCLGASSSLTLMFARDSGIVNETCFPYVQDRTDCSNKCLNPVERIKISNFSNLEGFTYEQIRKELINKGPIAGNVNNWVGGLGHSMCLVGFGKIEVGDIINANSNSPIIIRPNDTNLGKTYLIFKNSWGPFWGEKGYVNVIEETLDRVCLYTIDNPIRSKNYSDNSIPCNDFDGDGFYYWGLGPKSPQCPSCPDEPDGDDSDPCLGPLDENGNMQYYTSRPRVHDTTIIFGENMPELIAEGQNIAWYRDKDKTNLLHLGNNFTTGISEPGIFTFYVTQTISGCESNIQPMVLTINLEVKQPTTEDVTIYWGEPVPDLVAFGEDVKWYADKKNPLYDNRDGRIYETMLLGDQLWMSENLDFYTPTGSWYYNYDSLSFANPYGRLYSYQTALSACPDGWHLPSDDEWMEMEIYLGMSWREAHSFMLYRGETIGSRLKETGILHWTAPNTYATDEVGFKALPAGSYHMIYNSFNYIGTRAIFLTSTKYSENEYYIRDLIDYSEGIGRWCNSFQAYSVRCMRSITDYVFSGNSYNPGYVLPGKYAFYVTQTISGYESPPDTVILTILSDVRPPKIEDYSLCEGQLVPDFTVAGENIRWYGDAELTNLIHVGNTFATGQKAPGSYTYYVTQTYSNRESLPDTFTLKINPIPAPPLTKDLKCCEGNMNQSLYATGENIVWYSDVEQINVVGLGNILNPNNTIPGTYEYFVTQTLSGCEGQVDTVQYTIVARPAEPVANNATICEGEPVPDLTAEGGTIQWYSDSNLTDLVGSGNMFTPGQTIPGSYAYYVTQTLSGCESQADTVLFTIVPQPTVPTTNNVIICEGEHVPDITAEGDNIQWYSDSSLTNLVGSGNSFTTGQTIPGTYTYYVSQTISECESNAESLDLVIYPLSVIELGKDSTIYPDQSIILGPFSNDNSYLWNDGSQNPYFSISGNNLDPGSYQISVIVIDIHGCINSDTVIINIVPYSSISFTNNTKQINIFPNPAEEFTNIGLSNSQHEHIIFKIYNQRGEEIDVASMNPNNQNGILHLDVSHLPSGIYHIQILTNEKQYIGKIIVL